MLAEDLRINPLLLVITVILSCGYAFILPIGTSANSLVYYHANLKISDMVNVVVFYLFLMQKSSLRKDLKVQTLIIG
jgi:sodium-dependent dicarboxylate transporter 2/3/5